MAGRRKAAGEPRETPIEALRHKDTRKNIPTREQDELVADEEQAPETMLYPRDPTLDPQLVWKGKDEQDRQALEVPIVPIYIQETIKPQALVEDLRARAKGAKPQLDLFGDLQAQRDIEEQIEFYEHEDQWTNRMILGDSLVVMTSLAQKEGLKGKVQMIYMDPPYGIKFGSNWQVSTRKRDVKDGKPEDVVRQPEQIKAFRDTWEIGIHSYLAYLRERMQAARELLAESGSIFVQIGDENVHLVRCLLDETFGSGNFCGIIAYKTTSGLRSSFLASAKDWIIWYSRDRSKAKFRRLFDRKIRGEEGATQFGLLESPDGGVRLPAVDDDTVSEKLRDGWRLLSHGDLTSVGFTTTTDYDLTFQGKIYRLPAANARWKTPPDGMARLIAASRVMLVGNTPRYKRYMDDFPVYPLVDVWNDTGISGFGDKKMYVVQTNVKVIERCVLMATDPGDLVLDPTSGSGTTAAVAESWGRRWIVVDTSRVAVTLGRARLMAGKYPAYILRDSAEGARKEVELSGKADDSAADSRDIRRGFVYERVPHVTLRSIANNAEIDVISDRYREPMDRLRRRMKDLLGVVWEDWQIPVSAEAFWRREVVDVHAEWWQLRLARQKEIDASIARRADYEILYDQPYEDPKRIRVAGPFTVESLSPHRTIAPSSNAARAAERSATFVTTILENIKKAGVQNTIKNERLHLDRVTPFASRTGWIHAEGEFADRSRELRRVAISIGPEHGTVSPVQVRGAAKEALKHFHLLVVCGFAFDALAYEAAREFAPFPVMLARMNPDLAMGDELLKKTGAANLFMVFGEPDITLQKSRDGKLSVEIKGLDIYDPTTGEIRSHTTDDIACWFVDTDYNGDCFFVRQAYFTGATDPYEKLKRALKAEIDEATWESVRGTKSRPFDPPSTGMIAVKVINHYGDEVLKVYKTS